MLVDEVLAVGDAAFQQKCIDVFYGLRAEGKTIVLVTHAMSLVEQFCHRAMMLNGGEITHIGDPAEIARAYLSENFRTAPTDERHTERDAAIDAVDVWVTDANGDRVDAVAHGQRMCLHVLLEARETVRTPGISLWLSNDERVRVFAAGALENGGALGDLEPGERVEFTVEIENSLAAGRYYVGCSVVRGSAGMEPLLHRERAGDFVSYGAELYGIVDLDHTSSFTRLGAQEPVK
jgi:ABC-2 type transport system ATP-binding protein